MAWGRPEWLNRNVALVFLQSAVGGFGYGFAWNVPAVIYVYQITNNSNAKVGYIEGLQGLCQAAIAFPAGWAADYFGRDRVLKLCSLLTVVGIIMTGAAILSDEMLAADSWMARHRYTVLCFGYGILGICWGGAQPAADAIFADSTPTGARDKVYTVLGSISFFSNGAGQAVTMLLFYLLGNTWDLKNLTIIMVTGLIMQVPVALSQVLFDDKKSLGDESDSVQDQVRAASTSGDVPVDSAEAADCAGGEKDPKEADTDEDHEAEMIRKKAGKVLCGCVTVNWIPGIMFASDLLICLASGMTIKFFPVFFQQECGLSPVGVNAIFVVAPFLMAGVSPLAQKISSCGVGRMQTSLLFQWLGISMLALMALRDFGSFDLWTDKLLGVKSGAVMLMYIGRTVLMNSIWPLERSLMMDYVSKKQRAKWSSLDAITSFGWSGSAVIGGLLVDHFKVACVEGSPSCHGGVDDSRGFRVLFLITASMQMLSTLPKILICMIVPRNMKETIPTRKNKKKSEHGDENEEAPLLGEGGAPEHGAGSVQ